MSGSETLHLTIANGGSTPIDFNVTLPTLNQIPNTTAPTITISPMTGTLAPHTQLPLNVTVYMPSAKNKPGLSWHGIIGVVQVTNQTNPGGAVIQTGVAKIITITSASPVPLPLIDYIIAIIVVIAVVALAVFYLMKRRRSTSSSRAGRTAALVNARKRIRSKSRKGAGKRRKARASRKRTSGRKTRRRRR